MKILLSLLIIQGIILSLLLFTRKNNRLQNRLLGVFILSVSLTSGFEILSDIFTYESFLLGLSLKACLKFIIPTALFLYTKSITTETYKFSIKELSWAIATGLLFSITCYGLVGEMNLETFSNSIYGTYITALGFVFWFIYLPKCYKRLNLAKKAKQLNTSFLSLVRVLLFLILISLVLEVLDDLNDIFQFASNLDFFDYIDILFLGLIYFISYKSLSSPLMFHDIDGLVPKSENKERYSGSQLSEERLIEIQTQLEQLMEEEKPYLNGELSIQNLANRLNTSRQYLTQVINERMNCNYNDYINTFRIKEFKNLIQDPKNKNFTILSIAFDSGFNSKTSFNTIFKKHTGQTPSQYRKSRP